MKSGIHSIIISIFLIFSCTTVMAQEDSEYRMEIGGGVGMMTYEGDFNGSVMSGSNTSPSLMLILRRVINPYCALRFGIGYGKLKGASKDLQTYYPDSQRNRLERTMSLIIISLTSLRHTNIISSLTAQDMITVGHRDLRLSSVWASVSHTSTAKMAPSISRMQAVFLTEDW